MLARVWSIYAMRASAFISLAIGARTQHVRPLGRPARRLTSHQAGLYGIPDRDASRSARIADLLLFDPAKVGISALRRLDDLPGGGTRTIRDPIGVHGVFVNGTRVFDGKKLRAA